MRRFSDSLLRFQNRSRAHRAVFWVAFLGMFAAFQWLWTTQLLGWPYPTRGNLVVLGLGAAFAIYDVARFQRREKRT